MTDLLEFRWACKVVFGISPGLQGRESEKQIFSFSICHSLNILVNSFKGSLCQTSTELAYMACMMTRLDHLPFRPLSFRADPEVFSWYAKVI